MAWEMFDRDGNDGFRICGVDGELLERAPLPELPVACEVTIRAESASPAALATTERDLQRVADSAGGRIVATERTRTELWVLVHLPGDDDAHLFSKVSLPRRASISVAPAIDPEWTLFERARPVGIEEQSMLDFRVRARLHEAGDVGGVRPIEHVVDDIPQDRVAAFVAAVEAIGVTVTATDLGRVEMVHHADPGDVTETSWTVRQIAERHGGVSGGWGCEVLAPPGAGSKPKRRWFR